MLPSLVQTAHAHHFSPPAMQHPLGGAVSGQSMTTAGATARPKDVTLRQGRPDWSMEWRNAKTGGVSTHRRHCVRSGLMKAALDSTLNNAIELGQLNEFFASAQRILGADQRPVITLKQADLLVDRLFHRLHNNHMNIFYGRGSFNQMLGTLAHGLEKFEADYFEKIEQSIEKDQLNDAAQHWLENTIGYALCEYMDFSEQEKEAVQDAVIQNLDASTWTFDQTGAQKSIDEIHLFDSRPGEGPMEIKVHRERHQALLDVAGFITEQMQQILTGGAEAETNVTPEVSSLKEMKKALNLIATSTLDSADLDLSEASDEGVRRRQNKQAVDTTIGLQRLIDAPDIESFESLSHEFLSLEKEIGNFLGIGENYAQWFKIDSSREALFSAITAPEHMMVPSLESAKYAPRQWDQNIKKAFRVREGQQRVQVVPSILARQVGYAVSNYAVASGKLDELKRSYESIFDLNQGDISTLGELQKYHSTLIRKIHNNPTNIYIGSRASQMARENMQFALETNQNTLSVSELGSHENLAALSDDWLKGLMKTAVSGYLDLTAYELNKVGEVIEQVFLEGRVHSLGAVLQRELPKHLEIYDAQHLQRGPLARYDRYQIKGFQEKIQLIAQHGQSLKQKFDEIVSQGSQPQGDSLAHSLEQVKQVIQDLEASLLVKNTQVEQPEVKQAHETLEGCATQLVDIRNRCMTNEGPILEDYTKVMSEIIDSAVVARDFGLQKWARAVGCSKGR